MYKFERTFPDNDSYSDDKFLYSGELAEVLFIGFYKQESNDEFSLKRDFICLNDFVSVIENLTKLSQKEFGMINVEEALRKMSDDRSYGCYTMVHSEKGNLYIYNLQPEIKAIMLWSCELYCKLRIEADDEKSAWEASSNIFHEFLEEMQIDKWFMNKLIGSSEEALNYLIRSVGKRGDVHKSEKETLHEELKRKDEVIKELEERIKILTSEMPEVTVDGKQERVFIAKKVLKAMNADYSFPKATQWATIIGAITGAKPKTCNNILSDSASYTENLDKEIKKSINEAFKKVGLQISI